MGAILDRACTIAQAVVVLMTGDHLARLGTRDLKEGDPPYEKMSTPQARAHVLFEAGMVFGRHPERTILVTLGDVRPFSDIGCSRTTPASSAGSRASQSSGCGLIAWMGMVIRWGSRDSLREFLACGVPYL